MAKYRLTKVHHPKAFQKGVYSVNFKQVGKPFLDRYQKQTMVKARNKKEAVQKAKKELRI